MNLFDKTNLTLPVIVSLYCIFIISTLALFYFPITIEDAHITFRYARSFSESFGIGLWNTNEPPVEGFSSFLWMLILGFARSLGFSEFVISKVIGYLSLIFMSLMSSPSVYQNSGAPKGKSLSFGGHSFCILYALGMVRSLGNGSYIPSCASALAYALTDHYYKPAFAEPDGGRCFISHGPDSP